MRSRDVVAMSVPVVVGAVGWGCWVGFRAFRRAWGGRPLEVVDGRVFDPRLDALRDALVDVQAGLADVRSRVGETVVHESSPGGHDVQVEVVGGSDTWRGLLYHAMDLRDENFADVKHFLPGCEDGFLDAGWLDEGFNSRFGPVTSPPFTVWTSSNVYFPVVRNVGDHVRESVGCVPLHGAAVEYPVDHVG